MKSIANAGKAVVRSDGAWKRLVFAEVLVPGVANVFGDYWTEEAIIDAAHTFMRKGFGIDVEHDNVDILGSKAFVVESFIAREGDPDFIPGSWVVGMYIADDALWQRVLDGDINGFSYQASVSFLSATLTVEDDGIRQGYTEPDLTDGHRHYFMVMVDEDNRPIGGGTDTVNGHSHEITSHTVTGVSAGHTHRYNLVLGKDGK